MQTGTSDALHKLADQLPKRGMVIVISDFFDDIQSIVQALKHFRHNGHEVIAIQVLDPREKILILVQMLILKTLKLEKS